MHYGVKLAAMLRGLSLVFSRADVAGEAIANYHHLALHACLSTCMCAVAGKSGSQRWISLFRATATVG